LYIVNDILDLSKIEAGKLDLEHIDFEIMSVLGDLHRTMVHLANAKGLELSLNIPKDLVMNVVGDPGRLRQILLNLLSNAMKFTQKGKIEISGRLVEEKNDQVKVYFEVSDSGIGIPEKVIPLLFQPFSQGDTSTTRKFGGTGLGLSICQHLVQMMNGEIGVKSQVGHGSKFWFTLEFKKASKNQISVHAGSQPIKAKFRGRILVVEDNAVNQKVAIAMLERLGHRADLAGSGKEAINLLDQAPYDLILMDCQMPEMDGFEATQLIRANGSRKNPKDIPIVAMTANAIAGDREKCIRAGMNDYISKPVNFDKLDKTLQQWLVLPQKPS
jgi:two-component system, sensor histidine kinase